MLWWCFLLVFLCSIQTCFLSSPSPQLCLHDERYALLQFKQRHYAVNSYPKYYHPLKSWSKPNTDCCYWNGITCDGTTGHVIGLEIYNSSLSGSIHSNSTLFHLLHLQMLDLSWNDFDYFAPSGFDRLSRLMHLNLSGNHFSGQIPSQIAQLTDLFSLNLSFNHFIGQIPFGISRLTKLVFLDFSDNIDNSISQLEISNLRTFVQNLSRLRELRLDGVDLSAQKNRDWCLHLSSALPNLHVLSMRNCSLIGPLDASISSLRFLSELYLSWNQDISSTVPSSLLNLTALTILSFWGCDFHGDFPSSFFLQPNLVIVDLFDNPRLLVQLPKFPQVNNSSLQYLYVGRTKFQGKFPSSVGNLKFLKLLGLQDCNLYGPIPPSLANLTNLIVLDLSSNGIDGAIPKWIWKLQNLSYLILSNNSLTSLELPLPTNHSFNIEYLDLHSNKIQDCLPTAPCSSRTFNQSNSDQFVYPILGNLTSLLSKASFHFSISKNKLIGKIPLSICNARNLEVLDLSNNQLSGPIPTCLDSFTNLGVLNLGSNKLHGPIPSTFKNGCILHTLKLNNNMLQGKVPRSLGNCKKLKELDIGYNQLNGTFPYWFEIFSELQVLVMRSNNFGGSIGQLSHVDSPFPNLHVIDLSFNAFTGDLPWQYILHWRAMMTAENNSDLNYLNFQEKSNPNSYYQDTVAIVYKGQYMEMPGILSTLITIDLSNNNFKGEIPDDLGNLKALKLLNLSGNSLIGQIPFSLGNLSELESLDLSRNKLSGKIPRQLTSLTFLSVLNVSYNKLVGGIPQGNQFDTFSNASYEGNVGLCGCPLSRKCGVIETALPPASTSQENDDSRSLLDWKFVVAGYCSGLIIGLVVGRQLFWRNNRYFGCIFRIKGSR